MDVCFTKTECDAQVDKQQPGWRSSQWNLHVTPCWKSYGCHLLGLEFSVITACNLIWHWKFTCPSFHISTL